MYGLRKFFAQSPWRYIGAAILAAAVGAFRYSTLPAGLNVRFVCFEVLSVAGYVTFLIGALLTVSYFGAFDLFGYVFSSGRNGEHKKYKNYAHYTEQRTEKRAREGYIFVPYYVVGIGLVLISYLFG